MSGLFQPGRVFRGLVAVSCAFSALFAMDDEFFTPTTSIGGYGELHYNQVFQEGKDDAPIFDFHRFVLFFGHSFSEEWSVKSELELEHNVVLVSGKTNEDGEFSYKKTGEVELEQAFIQYQPIPAFGFRAGVMLTPSGLLNEDHEPPLFLTVERPLYAKDIIPTTWFGNGVGLQGSLADQKFTWQAVLMDGLDIRQAAPGGLRGGRLKGYKAPLNTVITGLRADYSPLPTVKAGASWHRNQLMMQDAEESFRVNAIDLLEVHAVGEISGIHARGEFAWINWDALDENPGNVEASMGWYADLGYDIGHALDWKAQLIPFVHVGQHNTAFSVRDDSDAEDANQVDLWKVGLALKPISQVVFKVDYGTTTKGDNSVDELNLGAGYNF